MDDLRQMHTTITPSVNWKEVQKIVNNKTFQGKYTIFMEEGKYKGPIKLENINGCLEFVANGKVELDATEHAEGVFFDIERCVDIVIKGIEFTNQSGSISIAFKSYKSLILLEKCKFEYSAKKPLLAELNLMSTLTLINECQGEYGEMKAFNFSKVQASGNPKIKGSCILSGGSTGISSNSGIIFSIDGDSPSETFASSNMIESVTYDTKGENYVIKDSVLGKKFEITTKDIGDLLKLIGKE